MHQHICVSINSHHRWTLAKAAGWCLAAAITTPALAQTYAPVLSSTPMYDVQTVPQTHCEPSQSHAATRCTTHMVREEQLLGYDVRYSHQGQEYVQRMPDDPGSRIRIGAPSPSHTYSSTSPPALDAANPAQKSYGSAPAGVATPDVIEYRNEGITPHVYIEVQRERPSSPPLQPPVYPPKRPQPAPH